nr:DUF2753 family protein [Aeromonas sp.]
MWLPQRPNLECRAIISEPDCCRAALTSFLKRYPNPEIATLIPRQGCALRGRFRLS